MRHPIRVNTYLSRGFYSMQVERFLRRFPRENCLFIKSEELLSEHDSVIPKILCFLGVDPEVKIPAERISPDIKAPNAGISLSSGSKLNPLLARVLALVYRRERARLKRLTEIDFCNWN